MSGSISGSFDAYGTLGRLGVDALALAQRSQTLTDQSASGLIAPAVADLGAATPLVLDLQPQLATLDGWSDNITAAGARIDVAQSALTSIGQIASTLSDTLTGLEGETGQSLSTALTSASQQATAALGQLGGLLNTQSGDTYVFAGAATGTPPVASTTALTSGALASGIASALGGLGTDGAAATLGQIVALAGNTAPGQPFSAFLSTPAAASATMPIGPGEAVAIGVTATTGGAPTATSTGSPIRDLVASLNAVAGLSASTGSPGDLTALITSLNQLATGAASGIATMQSTMGATTDMLTENGAIYQSAATAIGSQISSLTSVDLPSVSTELTATNNQLQASYELIAGMKSLSLANYL